MRSVWLKPLYEYLAGRLAPCLLFLPSVFSKKINTYKSISFQSKPHYRAGTGDDEGGG
jgi:hypothetical protein